MKAEDCKRFDGCSAPLCPMDMDSLISSAWFPGEDICPLHASCKLDWIRNQRKITKKSRNLDFDFTLRMLKQNCVISRGIKGLDPDHDISARERDENRWLKQHPEKRIISEEEREKLRKQLMKVRQGLIPPEKETIPLEKTNFSIPSAKEIMT